MLDILEISKGFIILVCFQSFIVIPDCSGAGCDLKLLSPLSEQGQHQHHDLAS